VHARNETPPTTWAGGVPYYFLVRVPVVAIAVAMAVVLSLGRLAANSGR
jgi:hypothetical protein